MAETEFLSTCFAVFGVPEKVFADQILHSEVDQSGQTKSILDKKFAGEMLFYESSGTGYNDFSTPPYRILLMKEGKKTGKKTGKKNEI